MNLMHSQFLGPIFLALAAAVGGVPLVSSTDQFSEESAPATSHSKKISITARLFAQELDSGEMVKMMHALGYFHAIEDIAEDAGRTCRPSGVPTKQVMDGLRQAIGDSSESSTMSAASFIDAHLVRMWPCATASTS